MARRKDNNQLRLGLWLPDETRMTKRELVRIINAQAHQLSAIMGLLDGYKITRGNLSVPGHYSLTPYGRVRAAIKLLHKCGAVSNDNESKDEPNAYQTVVFEALLKHQAAKPDPDCQHRG